MRSGMMFMLLCAVLTLACQPAENPSSDAIDNRVPIILISIDTLRADHLGCYGYHRETSPNIDRFAAEGVLFQDCVNTGGGTLPVHMSMLTSLSPGVHGVTPRSGRTLAPEHLTLAEVLREQGYQTAAFVDGGYLSGSFGFTQGFDVYFDRNFKGWRGKIESLFDDGGFAELLPRVRSWIEDRSDEPFFLFIHTYDVHSATDRLTYEAPEPFQSRFVADHWQGSFDGCREDRCASELLLWLNREIRQGRLDGHDFFTDAEIEYLIALYDGGIAYADDELGGFFDFLRNEDLYDRCLIVITSDHGEEFLEHGLMLHHQNYEEVAHVPLLIRSPGLAGGARITDLTSSIDLMPTLLDLAGLEIPGTVMGSSLADVARGTSESASAPVAIIGPLDKWRTPDWSLRASRKRARELYDLRIDRGEQRNLIDQNPEVADRLFESLQDWRARESAYREQVRLGEAVELDEKERERLRALGYLP